MIRYYLDTEFIENGETIDLISIGIVADDGREFYAENSDVDLSKADQWVKENVISNLWSRQLDKSKFNMWSRDGGVGGLLNRKEIARDIFTFCNPQTYGEPEFWAEYASYDWVVFCQLFGKMIDLPSGFPMYCNDIQQCRSHLDVFETELPKQEEGQHNALADAKHCKVLLEFLERQ